MRKRTNNVVVTSTNATSQTTVEITQARLDAALADQQRLRLRRDTVAYCVAEKRREIENLIFEDICCDTRQLENDIVNLNVEIESIDVVLRQIQSRVAELGAARNAELAAEALQVKRQYVETVETEMEQAITAFFTAAKTMVEAAKTIERGRDELLKSGFTGMVNWQRLSKAHAEAFGGLLTATFGPIERFSFPLWLFTMNAL